MANEVTTEVRETQSGGLLQQIIAASANPEVDAGKMKAMADLAIALQDRERVQQFQRDYIAAVMEMPVITKDGRIVIRDKATKAVTQSTPFARFEDLDRIVRPIANRWNLGYTFETGGELQTGIKVRCVLRHVNGHVERGDAMPLPIETSGSKNNVQGVGSTNSYGKRYALQNAFAIVAEGVDTDGHDPSTVVSLPHEREQLVLQEAEAAHAAGKYPEWYAAASPKDRAWVVANGHHQRFGGPALPAPTPKADPEPEPEPEQATRKGKGTPEQQRQDWVDRYVAKVDGLPDRSELAALQLSAADTLTKFREGYPGLHQQIEAAHARALDRFEGSDQ